MRVALYARYSSDNQKDSSIEQQMRLLRERVEAERWTVVGEYEDKALTGTNMMRPGLQRMLAASQDKLFDVILSESIDRLSRDLADIAAMHKRLTHRGVRIVTLMEGEITPLHVAMKGGMSDWVVKDLARRTYRGLQDRALQGESAGGLSYGYDIEPRYDEKRGRRIGGLRTINETQAAVVRRIFEDYCKGKSPRQIAQELNEEGIPTRNGGTWSASTIYGNRQRHTGILRNTLYVGRQCWNKQKFTKDPDTGRENGTLNDEAEWVWADVPHLRIISDELWERAQAKQAELERMGRPERQRRPRKLFSFLLKCGECGGGFAKVSATQYGCASSRNKGTCTNRLTISERKLEETVLGTLRERLMNRELSEIFCTEYAEHMNRIRHENNAALHGNRAELEKTERSIAKLVEAIKNGIDPLLIRDEINGLQARKLELEALLESTEESPIFIHPNMAKRYHDEVQRLVASLNEPEHRGESAEIIRKLIEKIVLTPNEARKALAIDLYGDLAGILQVSAGHAASKHATALAGPSLTAITEIQQVRLLAGADKPNDGTDEEPTRRKRWLGRQDSNLRMPVPKTGALPLGDAPAGGWTGAIAARPSGVKCWIAGGGRGRDNRS
jgi:site-specific DNA recombinase